MRNPDLKKQDLINLQFLIATVFAILFTFDPTTAAAQAIKVNCANIKADALEKTKGLTIIDGSCPANVDLSHLHIPGSLEFRDITGLKELDLSVARIGGSLDIIGVELKRLVLRGAQVSGRVYIAESAEEYPWIDNHADNEKCECQNKYGRIAYEEVDARFLSAQSFSMHGVGASKFSMQRARVDGLVTLSRAQFGNRNDDEDRREDISFHQLHALGLDLNSAVFPGILNAAQSKLASNLSLECSKIGKAFVFWDAELGGQLHMEGTHFDNTTELRGFSSKMRQLTLGAATGNIEFLRLDRADIEVLQLTSAVRRCVRQSTINDYGPTACPFIGYKVV